MLGVNVEGRCWVVEDSCCGQMLGVLGADVGVDVKILAIITTGGCRGRC